jgi:hypothetical protein
VTPHFNSYSCMTAKEIAAFVKWLKKEAIPFLNEFAANA